MFADGWKNDDHSLGRQGLVLVSRWDALCSWRQADAYIEETSTRNGSDERNTAPLGERERWWLVRLAIVNVVDDLAFD